MDTDKLGSGRGRESENAVLTADFADGRGLNKERDLVGFAGIRSQGSWSEALTARLSITAELILFCSLTIARSSPCPEGTYTMDVKYDDERRDFLTEANERNEAGIGHCLGITAFLSTRWPRRPIQ